MTSSRTFYDALKAYSGHSGPRRLARAKSRHVVQVVGATVPDGTRHVVYHLHVLSRLRGAQKTAIDALPSEAGLDSALVGRRFRDFERLRRSLLPIARKTRTPLPPLPYP
mgnify:FL=1